MRKTFQESIQAAIERMPPEFQAQTQAKIAAVVQAGGTSIDSLCRLAGDTRADTDIRATACWLIGQLGSKRCVRTLLDALRTPEQHLYWEAAKAIGAGQSARALRPLVALLAEPHENDMHAAIIYALGHLRNPRAAEPLIGVLSDRLAAPQLRGRAAEALSYLPYAEQIVDALIAQLIDPAPELRFWCAYALGQMGARRAIPALEQLARLQDTTMIANYGTVHQEALAAIAQIKGAHPLARVALHNKEQQ